jgi:integrase
LGINNDGSDWVNTVEPIRSIQTINTMKKLMLADGQYMYHLLFVCGINTGLRISDLLSLKFEHFLDSRHRIRNSFDIIEIKTGKRRRVTINKSVHKAVELLLANDPRREGYVFVKRGAPVSRSTVWRVLNKYAKEAGVRQKVGTHTMRKTFGYQLYKKGIDISRIQYMLNHSSPKDTLRYIGITQDEVDNIVEELNL